MSFADLSQRAWDLAIPMSALVELTYECNWDCTFCYNDLNLRGTRLETKDYYRVFQELKELGTIYLILSGGEPLAHPKFFEIASYARELEFSIRLKSNGQALAGPVARRVKEDVRPLLIEVSLHGAVAKTHDALTRVPGSFDKLINNIQELKSLGLDVKVNVPLTRLNEGEIGEIFSLVGMLDCPLQVDPEITPKDDGDLSPLRLSPSKEGVRRLMELEIERVKKFPRTYEKKKDARYKSKKNCGAGASTMVIDPYGNVYPCVAWRRKSGNVHEKDLSSIWHGRSMEEVRQITEQAKTWLENDPEAKAYKSFCPGNAEAMTGNPLAPYQQNLQSSQARQDVLARRLPIID